MIPCAHCSRFIRGDAVRCPFCDTVLRHTGSPPRPGTGTGTSSTSG